MNLLYSETMITKNRLMERKTYIQNEYKELNFNTHVLTFCDVDYQKFIKFASSQVLGRELRLIVSNLVK